jgi:hypothetical protein
MKDGQERKKKVTEKRRKQSAAPNLVTKVGGKAEDTATKVSHVALMTA